ncbi:hypothetical protein TNCT_106061 [Trichonephila clavata]|uniref:Uncharacterized protein n=1 Tax=Trichonephila clavata TaxID=2740835 RepID=A0A8X6GH79_TRICU|nr:hypothetical protein TNCT_106061 [Trichonephila clavata]
MNKQKSNNGRLHQALQTRIPALMLCKLPFPAGNRSAGAITFKTPTNLMKQYSITSGGNDKHHHMALNSCACEFSCSNNTSQT